MAAHRFPGPKGSSGSSGSLGSLGTALLAGAAPLALIALLAPLALSACGSDDASLPAASVPAASVPAASVPATTLPSAAPSLPTPSLPTPSLPTPSLPTPSLPAPSETPAPLPTPTPEPTLEPVGPLYLTIIPGTEIIMDDGCFEYENIIAATNKAAKKHQKAAKRVGKKTAAAQALRERARWVDADNLAEYNTAMLNAAQVALDQVSNGRSAEAAPFDQYLFDTIAFCGLTEANAEAQQRMLEINALAEKIRALAESALPDTT